MSRARSAKGEALLDAGRALRLLADASDELASSLDYETTLQNVARLAVPSFADWCAVRLVDESGCRVEQVAVAHRDPAREELARELSQRYPIDLTGPVGVARVIRTGEPTLDRELAEPDATATARDAEHRRRLLELRPRSRIVMPLLARGRTLGALSFMLVASGRRYGEGDLVLAMELAHRCALAIDNARLYRQAQEAVAARDQFISIASHELRTPLTTIRGYTQMLQMAHKAGTLDEARTTRFLDAIVRGVDRLNALTRDLLDVSRIRTGQLALQPQLLELAAFVREVAERQRELLGASHRLVVEAGGPCVVSADPARIEQVLANLIDNAAKYSPGGTIAVTQQTIRGEAEVRVRDEGIGLAPEALEAVFDLFGRAPNAAEQNAAGLGLGLYICRRIVEAHGGRIRAESPGPGRGATFVVSLPLAQGAAPAAGEGAPG